MAQTERDRRDASVRAAIKRMGGPGTVAAFLRAAKTTDARCLAVQRANDELDRGATIDDVFLNGSASFVLQVKRSSARVFDVMFGCIPGPLVGDGGEWDVEVDAEGRVVRCEERGMWVS